MKKIFSSLFFCAIFNIAVAETTLTDQLLELNVEGERISAVVNQKGNHPRYALILFPGSNEIVKARRVNGVIRYQKKETFCYAQDPIGWTTISSHYQRIRRHLKKI